MVIFKSKDWLVELNNDQYTVIDGEGKKCISKNVRVISSDTFVISHRYFPDLMINVTEQFSLHESWCGDCYRDQKIHDTVLGPEVKLVKMVELTRRDLRHRLKYNG